MDIVTTDFETLYDKEYSLSKMTTEAYIRDPRFEIIGVGVKVNGHPADWYSGENPGKFLKSLDYSKRAILAHNCVTGDHEVRTPDGWVRLDQLADGVPVMQWDSTTNALSYAVPATVLRKHYDGPMLEWKSSFHVGVYTPEHRMYAKTPNSQWFVATAAEVAAMGANNVYIPVSGILETSDPVLSWVTPLLARLIEMLRADGSLSLTSNTAKLHLSKTRKIERAMELLDSAGWKYTTTVTARGNTSIYLNANPELERIINLLGRGRSKQYASWVLGLSVAARTAILDELQYWDGHRGKQTRGTASKSRTAVTSSKKDDIYWLAELAIMTGRTATVVYDVPNARGYSRPDSVLHHVHIRPRDKAKTLYKPTEHHFSGMVYCVTVPTGAFLIRRNGATWVTGNCAFDGAILAWKFGIRPKLWLDTLSMARPLHGHVVSNSLKSLAEHYGLGVKGDEVIRALGKRRLDFTPQELAQYGAYCVNDVDLTYQLFLRLARGFPKDELRLIDLTLRMYTDPLIEIDTDLLTSHLQAVRERKQRLLTEFGGDDALGTIMSNPKFAEHLRSLGVEPPMKTSVRTGKETYAFSKTDQDFLALQEHPDERVAVAVATRLGAKSTIEETRTEALLGVAERGRLPIMLNYCGAHTGRFSGCLVADTKVLVFDHTQGVVEKRIVDVLLDDLVWDGEVFVPHEGVVFSGFAEVIEWDGVIGTEDHVVFTDAGEISLREAMQGAHRIQDARGPSQDDVDSARMFVRTGKEQSQATMRLRVR